MVRNSTMEPTFYEDQVGSNYGPAFNRIGGGAQVISNMKRNFSLDLNREGPQSKRPRLTPTTDNIQNLLAQHTLPDLLKLGTPDIEKLLIANENSIDNGQLITNIPTPTSQIYFQKVPTEEQEQYARGFVEALNELHHSDSSQEPGGIQYHTLEPPSSVQSTTTDSLLGPGVVQIKDEPQTVPSVSSSPPMSPIDMETQERIKLERKRQRNRVAASKCRRRKLERISRLEDKVKLLKGENNDLSQVVHRLREHVSRLKEQVIDHMHSGCQIAALPGMMSSI